MGDFGEDMEWGGNGVPRGGCSCVKLERIVGGGTVVFMDSHQTWR